MLRRFLQTLSTRRSTSPAKRLMDPVNNQQPQKFGNFDLLRAFQAPVRRHPQCGPHCLTTMAGGYFDYKI